MGLAWCCLMLAAVQEPTPQPVDSRLEQVTVFPQKALVERVFEVSSERAGEKRQSVVNDMTINLQVVAPSACSSELSKYRAGS